MTIHEGTRASTKRININVLSFIEVVLVVNNVRLTLDEMRKWSVMEISSAEQSGGGETRAANRVPGWEHRDIAELPGWKVSISVLYLEREWSDVYLWSCIQHRDIRSSLSRNQKEVQLTNSKLKRISTWMLLQTIFFKTLRNHVYDQILLTFSTELKPRRVAVRVISPRLQAICSSAEIVK